MFKIGAKVAFTIKELDTEYFKFGVRGAIYTVVGKEDGYSAPALVIEALNGYRTRVFELRLCNAEGLCDKSPIERKILQIKARREQLGYRF